jgi:Sec-independent protein translocase protein TatA
MKDLINTGQDRNKTKIAQRSSVVGTAASTFEKLGEVLLDLAKGISEIRKEQAEDTKDLKFVIASQDKRIDELEDRLSKLESHRLDLPINGGNDNEENI